MHSVFISYSTKDQNQAETVRSILEKNGILCWMAPRDIPGGSNYTREIPIAIRSCQVFVLILSQNAQNSPWVLKELDSAVNCGKVILPFMLEDCQLNDEFNFLLTGAQRYAAYQKKMEAMETLINRIRAITAQTPAQEQERPENIPAQEPAQEEPAAAEAPVAKQVFLGLAQCPACGSDEIEELTGKIGRYTPAEYLSWLLVPVMAMVGFGVLTMVAAVLSIFIPSADAATVIGVVAMLAGVVGGGIWGSKLSYELVRRQRVRKHIAEHPRRCKRCKKVFLVENT